MRMCFPSPMVRWCPSNSLCFAIFEYKKCVFFFALWLLHNGTKSTSWLWNTFKFFFSFSFFGTENVKLFVAVFVTSAQVFVHKNVQLSVQLNLIVELICVTTLLLSAGTVGNDTGWLSICTVNNDTVHDEKCFIHLRRRRDELYSSAMEADFERTVLSLNAASTIWNFAILYVYYSVACLKMLYSYWKKQTRSGLPVHRYEDILVLLSNPNWPICPNWRTKIMPHILKWTLCLFSSKLIQQYVCHKFVR